MEIRLVMKTARRVSLELAVSIRQKKCTVFL